MGTLLKILWAKILGAITWIYSDTDEKKYKRAVLTVAFVVSFLFRIQLPSFWPSPSVDIPVAPGGSVTVGPGGIGHTPPGKPTPVKPWANPSANLVVKPTVTDGKPSLDVKQQVFGLSLIPRAHFLWDFEKGRTTWALGAQLAWFDAFGLGPEANEYQAGLFLDRRFKIHNVENIAVGVGIMFPYSTLNKPQFTLGASFLLGR
jgi:hypothetical protein